MLRDALHDFGGKLTGTAEAYPLCLLDRGGVALSPVHVGFGSAVRALRVERKISREELADLAGIHRTYVGGVERGERNVSLANIVRLAENALGVRPSELMARGDL
jgi:predicted transcriptional regulator